MKSDIIKSNLSIYNKLIPDNKTPENVKKKMNNEQNQIRKSKFFHAFSIHY